MERIRLANRLLVVSLAAILPACRGEDGRVAPGPGEAPAAADSSRAPVDGLRPWPSGAGEAGTDGAVAAEAPRGELRAPAAGTSPPSTSESLTLETAIGIALARNPDLAVARRSEGVGMAAVEVAGTYPHNPQLGVDFRPWVRERGGEHADMLVAATLLQEIELARQGRHRLREGESELLRTRSTIEREEVLTISEAERAFATALYWHEALGIADDAARLGEELAGVTERRFEAGLTSGSAAALARVEAQVKRQEAGLVRVREEEALGALRQILAWPGARPLEPAGSLASWEWPSLQSPGERAPPGGAAGQADATEALVSARPDLRAAEAGSEAARARRDLAAAERIPNVTVGPIYEKDETGAQFLGFEVQIPIPIFSTGGPKERQMQAELERSLEELRQLRSRARTEAEVALGRYDRARRLAETFRGEVLQDFERNVERVERLFEAARTPVVEVYLAKSRLLQARRNALDALHELALAAADLTQATTIPYRALLPTPHGKDGRQEGEVPAGTRGPAENEVHREEP